MDHDRIREFVWREPTPARVTAAVGFAVAFGWAEQFLFRMFGAPEVVLGPLTYYHIVLMGPLFLIVALSTWWPLFPGLFVVEDIAYFWFHPVQYRHPESWVNFGFGGFWAGPYWIPYSYCFGVGSMVVLVGLFYWTRTRRQS